MITTSGPGRAPPTVYDRTGTPSTATVLCTAAGSGRPALAATTAVSPGGRDLGGGVVIQRRPGPQVHVVVGPGHEDGRPHRVADEREDQVQQRGTEGHPARVNEHGRRQEEHVGDDVVEAERHERG